METNDFLSCTVDRFEQSKAVLEFDGQQFLTISKRYLPKNTKPGDSLQVEFMTDEIVSKRRENLARAVLEEILNGGA
jgi:hypothetical protein